MQQHLTGSPGVEQGVADEQPTQDVVAGLLKQQHSPLSESEEDEYTKRTCLDYDAEKVCFV